jgi:hypothetical protein
LKAEGGSRKAEILSAPYPVPSDRDRDSLSGYESFIRSDVDRGLQIVGELKMLQDELDLIEARLETAGLEGEQVELNDSDRDGRQFLARGSAAIVPVVFTADLLVQSFQVDSDVHRRIILAIPAGHYVRDFFRSVRVFKTLFDSGKKFRAHAAELLGDSAPAFISACLQRDKDNIPKSKVVIDWQRAAAIAEAPNPKLQAPTGSEVAS